MRTTLHSHSGQIVRVDGRASVQFAAAPMWFRIYEIMDRQPVCEGWVWLEGCRLSDLLYPRQRREILVQPGGLAPITAGQLADIDQRRAAGLSRTGQPHARLRYEFAAACAR